MPAHFFAAKWHSTLIWAQRPTLLIQTLTKWLKFFAKRRNWEKNFNSLNQIMVIVYVLVPLLPTLSNYASCFTKFIISMMFIQILIVGGILKVLFTITITISLAYSLTENLTKNWYVDREFFNETQTIKFEKKVR